MDLSSPVFGPLSIPLARPGKTIEVANAVYFLRKDECPSVTGQTIVVNGGLSITLV